MLDCREYPGLTAVLNVNYRCTPQILKCAGRLIAHNQKRFAKELRQPGRWRTGGIPAVCQRPGGNGASGQGDPEAAEDGGAYEETAVLLRTNTGCRAAVEQLMAWQIPFRVRDAIPCLYDHWIAGNVLAYLRLGAGGRKRSDFLQICNRPNRYLNREAFYDSQVSFEELYQYYEDREWMWERIERLEADLRTLGRLSPYGAIQYIRHGIGYEQYVKEYALERKISEAELLQILDELAESARNFRDLDGWLAHIREYREEMQKKNKRQDGQKGVTVSTLHGVKGMEYDTVYILDVNEGVIPYHKSAGG
ncbi:MAG: 3'-5' exonuclease [Eisenbergiella sp.]